MHDFLRDSIRSAESHNNFDAFGHIDYICRYWPYADKEFHMEENRQEWDRLFTVLIEKNKPIEINTRRLDSEAAVKALLPLYKRYKELERINPLKSTHGGWIPRRRLTRCCLYTNGIKNWAANTARWAATPITRSILAGVWV